MSSRNYVIIITTTIIIEFQKGQCGGQPLTCMQGDFNARFDAQ
jgi:hypothetical protein